MTTGADFMFLDYCRDLRKMNNLSQDKDCMLHKLFAVPCTYLISFAIQTDFHLNNTNKNMVGGSKNCKLSSSVTC